MSGFLVAARNDPRSYEDNTVIRNFVITVETSPDVLTQIQSTDLTDLTDLTNLLTPGKFKITNINRVPINTKDDFKQAIATPAPIYKGGKRQTKDWRKSNLNKNMRKTKKPRYY